MPSKIHENDDMVCSVWRLASIGEVASGEHAQRGEQALLHADHFLRGELRQRSVAEPPAIQTCPRRIAAVMSSCVAGVPAATRRSANSSDSLSSGKASAAKAVASWPSIAPAARPSRARRRSRRCRARNCSRAVRASNDFGCLAARDSSLKRASRSSEIRILRVVMPGTYRSAFRTTFRHTDAPARGRTEGRGTVTDKDPADGEGGTPGRPAGSRCADAPGPRRTESSDD